MSLRVVAALGCVAVGLMSVSAQADQISTFQASGLFDNGATLDGTLLIDVTSGVITTSNLFTTSPISYSYPFVDQQGFNQDAQAYLAFTTTDSTENVGLSLEFPTTDLVGYNGGFLDSLTNPSVVNGTDFVSSFF